MPSSSEESLMSQIWSDLIVENYSCLERDDYNVCSFSVLNPVCVKA